VCGAFCLLVVAIGGEVEAPHGASVWAALAVIAVFSSAVGFFVQTFAQRNAPPARTALILASEPAFAGLFGWLLAGDHLSAVAWLGAVLIMGAILAVEVVPRFRPPRPLPEG
jgi:drug/metabolite transporter (DMT)-like permease